MCLPVFEDADRDRAKAAARDNVARAIARSPASSAALADLGFTSEEITNVSDRLVDALAGYGDPGAIATKVREHLAAGPITSR